MPRPKVYWDPIAAVISYDGQLATSGITTVLDSLRVWREDGAEDVDGRAGILAEAITTARDGNCCVPNTSCICAVKSRCPTWSRKPGAD